MHTKQKKDPVLPLSLVPCPSAKAKFVNHSRQLKDYYIVLMGVIEP